MKALHQSHFAVTRLGVIMRPDPMRDEEVEGVLNPGAARAPDGELYLFPRVVAMNNFSRIAIARVIFDRDGDPIGVDRVGYALEPEEPYELRPDGTGGVEDARVTFVDSLGLYVMTYVALGPTGPRVALAISDNCLHWERLGPVDFEAGKDAAIVPELLQTRGGDVFVGMFLRAPSGIWLSGADYTSVKRDIRNLRLMRRHQLIAQPGAPWETLHVGLGTPPVRTSLGYMIVYHGASGELAGTKRERNRVNYDAGVLIFRREHDRMLRHRSSTPILTPEIDGDVHGAVNNVMFPTGIDRRADDVYDVYYGMSDKHIGAARLWLPDSVDYEEVS